MDDPSDGVNCQSLTADDFFYFFFQLRKHRIRAVVDQIRKMHPHARPDEIAQYLIASHENLSLMAGVALQLPLALPAVGMVLRAIGAAVGSSVLVRMHLYLILEIALAYGRDIDDPARVPEMMAVIGATGASIAGPPVMAQVLAVSPILAIPVGGLTATAMTRMIGTAAIEHYSKEPSILPKTVEIAAEPLS